MHGNGDSVNYFTCSGCFEGWCRWVDAEGRMNECCPDSDLMIDRKETYESHST